MILHGFDTDLSSFSAYFEADAVRDRVRLYDLLGLTYKKDEKIYIFLTNKTLDIPESHAKFTLPGADDQDQQDLGADLFTADLREEG